MDGNNRFLLRHTKKAVHSDDYWFLYDDNSKGQ